MSTIPAWDGIIKDGVGGKGRAAFIFGPRGSGKSVLTKYIMYLNHKKYYVAMGMSQVEPTCMEYEEVMPPSFVFDHLNEAAITSIRQIIKKLKRDPKFNGFQTFIMIDDATTGKSAFKGTFMMDLYMRSRHDDMTVAFVTQNTNDVPPKIRQQTNVCIAPANAPKRFHVKIHEYFFGDAFDKFADYYAMVQYLARTPYTFVVLDTCAQGATPRDKVFYFRAPTHIPKFRMGHRDFWLQDFMYRKREQKMNIYETLRTFNKPKNDFALGSLGEIKPVEPSVTEIIREEESEERKHESRDQHHSIASTVRRPPSHLSHHRRSRHRDSRHSQLRNSHRPSTVGMMNRGHSAITRFTDTQLPTVFER